MARLWYSKRPLRMARCSYGGRVHAKCTPTEVTWPDLQQVRLEQMWCTCTVLHVDVLVWQVFRSAVSEEAWHSGLDAEWPPLAPHVTLRLKVARDQIEKVLKGEWRMFCKPNGADPFSYGLLIESVNLKSWTLTGRSRVEGKYVLENGRINYDAKTSRCCISYTEVALVCVVCVACLTAYEALCGYVCRYGPMARGMIWWLV